MKKLIPLIVSTMTISQAANAQLAKDNQCKFLGNITTSYNWVEYADPQGISTTYTDLWNQITPENGSKWGSIESTRDVMNWTECDRTYNYAKEHGIKFKFHVLVWGSQYPTWMDNLSQSEQYEEIVEWFDAVKERYPDLEYIDVVNEAISGHAPAPYKDALGGDGTSGYDWIVKAFKMARERWPNAVLIYNDYNTFQWQKTEFIDLLQKIVAAGAPIDAAGCQSHDLNDMSGTQFKTALEEIHDKTGLPIYITEYDIAKSDDAEQLTRYKEQFPVMWEADYVAGVTLWGWIYGKTWTTDGNSGLIKDGTERPALTWLREYMATDAAKNAKSPICAADGITATLSLSKTTANVGDEITITAEATATEGTVDHISMYANDNLLVNKYIQPYTWTYTPDESGDVTIKIIAYDSNGNTAEKSVTLTVCDQRIHYGTSKMLIPGTLEAEDFDLGCEGDAYHDTDNENEGGKYREDTGVDIVEGNGNYALGYTASGEWTEYTVDVEEDGLYEIEAYAASGSDNSAFHLSIIKDNTETAITDKITVPNGGDWDTYSAISSDLKTKLTKGEQVVRLSIDGSYVNIDKIIFKCKECVETSVESTPSSKGIIVFPNPITDVMTIQTDEEIKMTKIIDSTGKTLKTGTSKVINVSDIEDGIYTLTVETNKQTKNQIIMIKKK